VLIQDNENAVILTPFGSLIRMTPVILDGKASRNCFALSPLRSGATLAPASAPFWTLHARSESAAGQARYFAICGRPGWGFDPNNLLHFAAQFGHSN